MNLPRREQQGRSVWTSAEVDRDRSWEVTLAPAQRRVIVDAALDAQRRGCTVATIDRQTFSLDGLEDEIVRWSAELEQGRGFLLIHGFPIEMLDESATEIAYAGLGAHLGTAVGQNRAGDLLTHIRDERLPDGTGKVRLYRTRERQDFHTDGADIIGLLCLHRARSGGESKIVSSLAIYNEMLRSRPDLLEELYSPYHWDRQDEELPGEKPWFVLTPISDPTTAGGSPRLFYIGWYLRDAQRHSDVPRLTKAQLEAMEMVERLANDPAYHLVMDFQPGDVQLLNNGRILHAREAYEDDDDPAERRHLLRLWLAAHRFKSLDDGLRLGINTPARAR